MAKTKQFVVGSMTRVSLADIHWLDSRNSRKSYPFAEPSYNADTDLFSGGAYVGPGTFTSLVKDGWLPLYTVDAYLADAKAQKEAQDDRNRLLKEWESNPDTRGLAALMSRVWTKPPTLIGNQGHCRAKSLPYVFLAAEKRALALGGTFDYTAFSVPVNVVEYASEIDRLVAQSYENDAEDSRAYAPAEHFLLAQAIMRAGGKEADVTRALGNKRGTAQKFCRLVQVAARFPELNIGERLLMDRPKETTGYEVDGYLAAQSLDKEKVKSLILDNADDLDASDVEKKLKEIITGKGNAKKVTDRKAWESLRNAAEKGSPIHAIASAHLSGKNFDSIAKKYPELYSAGYVAGEVKTKAKK